MQPYKGLCVSERSGLLSGVSHLRDERVMLKLALFALPVYTV